MNIQGTREVKTETYLLGKPLALLPALRRFWGSSQEALGQNFWSDPEGFPQP